MTYALLIHLWIKNKGFKVTFTDMPKILHVSILGLMVKKTSNYNPVQKLSTYKLRKTVCSGSHKQFKTLFKDHMVRLKIMPLYIYKDLRLRSNLTSNESRDHYHEDGNLVPSPRCGFSF